MILFNNVENAKEYLRKYSGYNRSLWQGKDEYQILNIASKIYERREKLIKDLITFCQENEEIANTNIIPYPTFSIPYISSLKYTELLEMNIIYKIIQLETKNYQYLTKCYSYEELYGLTYDELKVISKEVNIKIAKRRKKPPIIPSTSSRITYQDEYDDYEPEIRTIEERRAMGIPDDATKEEKLRYGVVDEEVSEEEKVTTILDEVYEMIDTILASNITTKDFGKLYALPYEKLKELYIHAGNKLASEEKANIPKKM